MTDHTELGFHPDESVVDRGRVGRRPKFIGPVAASIGVITLTLVMVAESRMTPEQRAELFEVSSHVYP
jgi:hypothetical protein